MKKWGCGEIIGVILIMGIIFGVGLNFLYKGLAEDKVGTAVPGALVAVVPLLFLFGWITSKLGERFQWSNRAVVIMTVVISIASLTAVGIGMRKMVLLRVPSKAIYSEAGLACQGMGVLEAAGYQAGQAAPYHVVVLKSSGQLDIWSSEVDPSWMPDTIQDLNLVLCLGDSRTFSDNDCGYRRTHGERDLWLVDAHTGETLAEKTLTCFAPPCVLVKSGATDTSCALRFRQAEDWVESILNP